MIRQDLTTAPAALAGLDSSSEYVLQPTGGRKVWVYIGTSAPVDETGAFVVPAWAFVRVRRPTPDHEVHIWSADGVGAVVAERATIFRPVAVGP